MSGGRKKAFSWWFFCPCVFDQIVNKNSIINLFNKIMKNNDSTVENIEENSKKTAKVSTRKSIKLDKSKEI